MPYICTIKITQNIIPAMTTTVNLSLTDYMKIAALVSDSATDESGNYEVEYTANGYSLFLDIEHEIEYRTEIGGSYENYDFERLTVVDNEQYDVTGFDCYDNEGEPVTCDFTTKRLLDILN